MRSPMEQVATLTATTDQLQEELESLQRIILSVVIVQIVLTMLIVRHWQ